MNLFKFSLKLTLQILFVIFFFSSLQAKNLDKFNDGDNISDYFSGIVHLNANQYNESSRFLKKLNGLEEIHPRYSSSYIYSLVNQGKFNEAFNYAKKLEKNKLFLIILPFFVRGIKNFFKFNDFFTGVV